MVKQQEQEQRLRLMVQQQEQERQRLMAEEQEPQRITSWNLALLLSDGATAAAIY